MYPFNTILRAVLTYNERDPRHTGSSFGVFPRDIAPNILHNLPLHDAASFRNASMINLYSYFECGEVRTEHGARKATQRMGATMSMSQLHFNMHSVLDLLRDHSRVTTPASKARILAGLIDEIIRCGLRPVRDEDAAWEVAVSVVAAMAELSASERAAMRWRLVNPLSSDVAFGCQHQFVYFKTAIELSENLPVEDRELFRLVHKVHYFWLSPRANNSNMTPDEITDLISNIASLPHERQVSLLTLLADKIARTSNRGQTCDQGRVALVSACQDWPFFERTGILASVSPPMSYRHVDFAWNEDQLADMQSRQAFLNDYRLLPTNQKPAALAQMIRCFAYILRRSGSRFKLLPTYLPWTMASTMLAEAAKLKSVHSSALVMADFHNVTDRFDFRSSKESVAIFKKAFSAANEHEARTRSRQLICLDPESSLLAALCAGNSTLHPKTKLAASLLLRIAKLNNWLGHVTAIKRHAIQSSEAIAIWKEASALGSRRCGDIRHKLLSELDKLPPPSLLPTLEIILKNSRRLSPALKLSLCNLFAGIRPGRDELEPPALHVIDAVIDLALSLPDREMAGTLRYVMNAGSIDLMGNTAAMALLGRVVAKCLAMPTTVMAPVLIELANSIRFRMLADCLSAKPLFYRILEKSAGLDAEHKGPLLAALAYWFDFNGGAVLEDVYNALITAVDTLPEASRSAWRLYLRIATGYRQPHDRDPGATDRVVAALREECTALGGPQADLLSTMIRRSFLTRHGRFNAANY